MNTKTKMGTGAGNASRPELDEASVKGASEVAKKLPLFGHVVWLYTQSPASRYYFIQDMESRVLPALVLDQCKVYLQTSGGSLPIAYVSWAYLSPDAEERFLATQRIAPSDWKSGENLWLIDVLAPFGGEQAILKELFNDELKNREVFLLYPSSGGGLQKKSLSELIGSESEAGAAADQDERIKH
ncbi:MAG: toxin-activating lysine-acyltransferase [Arenicellales bacterium]